MEVPDRKYLNMSPEEQIQLIHVLESDLSKLRVQNMKLTSKVKDLEEKRIIN